jgi:putative membrane protein
MVKALLRNTLIYSVSLFFLPDIVTGVKIMGGIQTILIGGIILTAMFMLLKPIFNILTFPFNIVTLGLFSLVTNAVILYLLTVFMPNISITSFYFPGASLAGFTINALQINTLFSFLIASIIVSVISNSLQWLNK